MSADCEPKHPEPRLIDVEVAFVSQGNEPVPMNEKQFDFFREIINRHHLELSCNWLEGNYLEGYQVTKVELVNNRLTFYVRPEK